MVQYNTSEQHKDLTTTRQGKDMADSCELLEFLECRNPFSDGGTTYGAQPTMICVGSTQSTSPEHMDMPLFSSPGTRKDYPRKMVPMNAAQVEEQAQHWISDGIWS